MKTVYTKPTDVDRKWFVVDADGKVLGRLAAEVASILRGKKKPAYQPNVDTGDYVIVINADKIRLTGAKADAKEYWVHSRYAGHSRAIPFRSMKAKHPERVVEHAVRGMLPHNTLGRQMYRKLRVYAGPEHEHQAQSPETYEF